MSRSNPSLTNPGRKFFKWSGSRGQLTYYDKEQQKEFEAKLPFEFLVLDQLSTVTGFYDMEESSFWSNEIRSLANDKFIVKTSKGIKQEGLYKDLTDVRSKGAKYAKSVYIAYKEDDDYTIGNIKASGIALTAWINFCKQYTVDNGKVILTGSKEGKKGATTFRVPTFEWRASESLEDETAVKLDKELQIYLNQYLNPRTNIFNKDDPQDDWVPTDDEYLKYDVSDDLGAIGL